MTNSRFSKFRPELRETTPFEELDFLVFDTLKKMEAADRAAQGSQPVASGTVTEACRRPALVPPAVSAVSQVSTQALPKAPLETPMKNALSPADAVRKKRRVTFRD